MSEEDRLRSELKKAKDDLSRSERFARDHKDRGHKRQAKLAKEYVERDSERVYKIRRKLGEER